MENNILTFKKELENTDNFFVYGAGRIAGIVCRFFKTRKFVG